MLPVEAIAAQELVPWLAAQATAAGVRFDVIVAAPIVRLAGPRTRDIVQLARATCDWAHGAGVAERHAPETAMEALVREEGALHQRQWDRLREVAQRVLVVLATAPDVAILAAETLERFSLGPKSTVARALNDLVHDEVLVRGPASGSSSGGSMGGSGYAFDDPLFCRWVQVNASADLGRRPPRLMSGDPPG